VDHAPLVGHPPATRRAVVIAAGVTSAVPCRSSSTERIWSPPVGHAGLQGHVDDLGAGGRHRWLLLRKLCGTLRWGPGIDYRNVYGNDCNYGR
jgi:hypothetical protein